MIETKKVFKSLTYTSSIAKPVTKIEKKETAVQQNRFVLKDQKNILKERTVSTVSRTLAKVEVPSALKKVETVAAAPTRRSGRITRRSLLSNSDDNSLYVSALDDS